MIFGRPTNLWLGAVTAIWGAAVVIFKIDSAVAGAVGAALGAVILLVANTTPGPNTPTAIAGAPATNGK